jgi:hypothetical protein
VLREALDSANGLRATSDVAVAAASARATPDAAVVNVEINLGAMKTRSRVRLPGPAGEARRRTADRFLTALGVPERAAGQGFQDVFSGL